MDQELVQYLDERFGRIEQRLDGHDGRFESIDRRFEGIDRRFDEVDRRFDEVNERIEEVKRHSGVLVEGLRHELHLVAEGLTMHIQVQHVQEREYFDRKFEDTHALIRSSYDHLHQRVENLERNRPN
jgi:archaellum component FlaC